MKYLVRKGADVSLANTTGWNPLHHAAFHGHTRIVKFLLREGKADPLVKNNYGASALNIAVSGGYQSIIK